MTVTVIACGAPLASRIPSLLQDLKQRSLTVGRIIVTTDARRWVTVEPESAQTSQPPDLLVIFPLTFNTANKAATGIADTQAAAVLTEAIGDGVPVLAVPMLKHSLAAHPVWPRTVDALSSAGWRWYSPGRQQTTSVPEPVASGTGDQVAAEFDTGKLADVIAQLVPPATH